jgi:hypothetical protein
MKTLAVLLTVTGTLSATACDQRTPAEPKLAARRSTTASNATGSFSASGSIEVQINGDAKIIQQTLNVPITIVNGVALEVCTGFGEARALPLRGTSGAAAATWESNGRTTQIVLSYAGSLTWTDGPVTVDFTVQCPSGSGSDKKTIHAHP